MNKRRIQINIEKRARGCKGEKNRTQKQHYGRKRKRKGGDYLRKKVVWGPKGGQL